MKIKILFVILLIIVPVSALAEDIFLFRAICINHGYSPRYTPWTDERFSKVSMFPGRTYLSCDDFQVQLHHIFGTWTEDYETLKNRADIKRQYIRLDSDVTPSPTWYNQSNPGRADRIAGGGRGTRTFAWENEWPENYWAVHHNVDGTASGTARRVYFSYDDGRIEHEFTFVAWSPAP